MSSKRKTLGAILAGGVVLASGAYGIGTQTGGGGASALLGAGFGPQLDPDAAPEPVRQA